MRNIIGVDLQSVYFAARKRGLKVRFPFDQIKKLVEDDNDEVIEMYSPVIRFPSSGLSDADALANYRKFENFRTALEEQGVSVIEAPAKPAGDDIKHSDDQRLMIRLALSCTRMKPDFLVLVASDGDYAPLVWGLREEGIRTKLITDLSMAAPELKRSCYSVSDMWKVIQIATSAEDEWE